MPKNGDCQESSLDMHFMREGMKKGDILAADIE